MFPGSDEDFKVLLDVEGPHHAQKKPPPSPEIDPHIFFLPAELQFSLNEKGGARMYAVTANYSYFPTSVEISFQQSDDVVDLIGAMRQTAKVPPVDEDGEPGVKARFVSLRVTIPAARTDIGAEWEIPKGGKTVRSELMVATETA